ncbi:MAG: peptidoglycan-associated lipoprotein Pal [Acidobacteriota bacterium]
MTFRSPMMIVAVSLAVFAVGCKPKPPAPPAAPIETKIEAPAPKTDVKPPPAAPTDGDPQPDPLAGDIVEAQKYAEENGLLGIVYYDFDSYELSSSAEDRLAKNASFMAEHPEFTFSIEGHCDDRGTNEYNLALGERRASAAMNYVAGKGVTGDRLKTISYGEERGVCSEQSESCWRQNRRAYFRITGRR